MKTAFVFPGQGSQLVGMACLPDRQGKDLAEKYLDQANAILGFDLKRICFEGPEEELKKTEITQPAILTVSIAAFEWLKSQGVPSPSAVAGHSLGEYSALVAAGAIQFDDAVKIVHLRGKFMQEAVPLGTGSMMAVLGAERKTIEEVCQQIGEVWPANYNTAGQIVISGKKEKVEAAGEKLKAAGAKRVVPLQVSAPFHCPLMQPAADKLKIELDKIAIKDAQIPVVANVSADYVILGSEIKELLIRQVTSPVRWEDSIKKLVAEGYSHFIEIGPGKVLAGLIKTIERSAETKNYTEVNL
jgi:[acyl-carrier-protein] S-malonyltransferase